MKRRTNLIAGVIFLIVCLLAITFYPINPNNVTPIQSSESKQAGILTGLAQGMVLTQELSAAKDYLTGIDLVFTQGGRNNTNRNTLLVLDTAYKVLFRTTFGSNILKEGDFTHFSTDRPLLIGKGNRFLISLFSPDGSAGNAASPLMNMKDSLGRFMTSRLNADDIMASVRQTTMTYPGSLMLKTYETNQSQFWMLKVLLYLISLIVAAAIIWFAPLSSWLARITIRPEWAFVAAALPFSLLFAIVTPPFQVPDEGTHFKLSYNLSELGFLEKKKTTPLSIANLDTSFMHLRFLAGKKTTPEEIKSYLPVKIEADNRIPLRVADYNLPYLPQAIGITAGQWFSSSALTLLYFGRFFNLLFALIITFFAIRIIPPPFRIMLMLLALMPKTIFLFGSLSYDSLTITLSFLTIAIFFYYAYTWDKPIRMRELVLMAIPVLLLLFCKPPYFLLGTLFFIIPPSKFGRLYRYILIVIAAAVIGITFLKVIPTVNNTLTRLENVEAPAPIVMNQLGQIVGDSSMLNQPLFRPDEQLKKILSDIPGYLGIAFRSGFVYYREYLMESFVGVLGYIDVELPDFLSYSYLILLLLTGMIISRKEIRLHIGKKTLFAALLIITFILIETAMFLYATRPGRDRVFGVQGRYFIPVAPLFFMLFYNRWLQPRLNLIMSRRRSEYRKAKPKAKPVILEEILSGNIMEKYLFFALVIYCLFVLIYSVHLTVIRYYI